MLALGHCRKSAPPLNLISRSDGERMSLVVPVVSGFAFSPFAFRPAISVLSKMPIRLHARRFGEGLSARR